MDKKSKKNNVIKRFNEVLSSLKSAGFIYNETDFSKKTGISRSFISDMKTGSKIISEQTVLKITSVFSNISSTWFLTGEGEMFQNAELPVPVGRVPVFDNTEKFNYRMVPLINFDFVGGMHGSSNVVVSDTEYIIGELPFMDAQEADICTQITGDSMAPTCPAGAIVLMREIRNWYEYLGYGNIFCVQLTDGRRILKEISKSNENVREYVLCVSHNTNSPPEELPKKMIHRVWKVIQILINKGW